MTKNDEIKAEIAEIYSQSPLRKLLEEMDSILAMYGWTRLISGSKAIIIPQNIIEKLKKTDDV